MKPTDVFPGSAKLVEGELPPASLLLIGQSGVGKTVFCKQFLYNGLVIGEPGIYVATNELPDEIRKSMKRFGFDIETYEKNGLFRIVDCSSWKTGIKSSGEYFVNNPAELAVVLVTIEKAMQGLKNIRLVLDSITGLTTICSQNISYLTKFFQVLAGKIRTASGKAIFTVIPEAHDPQFMSFLRLTFDGTLEMKEDESGKEIRRLLRVFSLKEANHKTNWTPFEITNHGVIVKTEDELRCVMCARLIEWKPITEVVGGKTYTFDSPGCVSTYKKLKSLYGENFE